MEDMQETSNDIKIVSLIEEHENKMRHFQDQLNILKQEKRTKNESLPSTKYMDKFSARAQEYKYDELPGLNEKKIYRKTAYIAAGLCTLFLGAATILMIKNYSN
ncbi:hypothetical protein ENBRE01_0669 [Enteropsectra breve]|nr:hypothetical protein ENBRE01_0669 [Enteropsectra breve]